MTTKLRSTLLILLAITIFSSCGSGRNEKNLNIAMESAGVAPAPPEMNDERSSDRNENLFDRKIIKTGEIRFETKDVKATESIILKAVAEVRGYVSNDNVYNETDRITHTLTIRVPADKFDILLSQISESAKKLESKSVNANDVTEEYIDVESRLKTKKELENRYKELLVKARTVEDILAIEKEMGTLRTDIESIEGRLKYLKDQIGFSTLTVSFYELTSSTFDFSSRFGQAIVTGWKWLLSFIIGVIHFWPFLLLAGGAVSLAFILKGRKWKK